MKYAATMLQVFCLLCFVCGVTARGWSWHLYLYLLAAILYGISIRVIAATPWKTDMTMKMLYLMGSVICLVVMLYASLLLYLLYWKS